MNAGDKCSNCGGDYALHHFQTGQCPVGGREAPLDQKQEWKVSTFSPVQIEYSKALIAAQAETIAKLKEQLEYCAKFIKNAQITGSGFLYGREAQEPMVQEIHNLLEQLRQK